MTSLQTTIQINPYMNALVNLELDKDLSPGHWLGEVIYTNLEVLEFYDNEGEPICETPCLTGQLIEVINREMYSNHPKTKLYDDCLSEYYEDHGLVERDV